MSNGDREILAVVIALAAVIFIIAFRVMQAVF